MHIGYSHNMLLCQHCPIQVWPFLIRSDWPLYPYYSLPSTQQHPISILSTILLILWFTIGCGLSQMFWLLFNLILIEYLKKCSLSILGRTFSEQPMPFLPLPDTSTSLLPCFLCNCSYSATSPSSQPAQTPPPQSITV